MATPIEVLSRDAVTERVESGLMIPMHLGQGLRVVDCGDERSLTAAYYAKRMHALGAEVSPGRYFGAVSGLSATVLIAFAAEHGDAAVTKFVDDYTPEGFVNLSSDLSDRAYALSSGGVDLCQHSAEGNERNPIELADHKTNEDPLGCKFATELGGILLTADKPEVITEAKAVLAEAGMDLPVDGAVEGIRIMQRHIPPNFSIHRGALHFAQTRSGLYTPVAIHEGQHAPNDRTALVTDLAGYRSNANRHNAQGMPRYHHTPGLASDLLPRLMPEINLNPSLLDAAGVLLGAATRLALSNNSKPPLSNEVIPPDLAAA